MRPEDNSFRGTPNCFCGLSASPAYSEEFGLLYECHYLHNNPWKEVTEEQPVASEAVNGRGSPNNDQSDNSVESSSMSSSTRQIDTKKAICGYHIHKDAWDSFFDSNLNKNHKELTICPFFNFTFCAFFGSQNSYPLSHPPPPNCFCGLPVTMRHVSNRAEFHRGKLMFTCPNYLIDGARPKCTWKLWANEVPFQRSNGCTHPLQKQGAIRLLDPNRQIQNSDRSIVKRETYSNRNSASRGRSDNNDRSYRHGDKTSPFKKDSNYNSSERFDRNYHRRESESRDQRDLCQQHTSSNGSSRRIGNGTGSSYSRWDPGRPARWNNNGFCRGDSLNGQRNSSTDQQPTSPRLGDNSSKDKGVLVNNSNREQLVSDDRKSVFDRSVKSCFEKDIIESSTFVGQTNPRSGYSEESYGEENGSSSLSNRTDSPRLSITDVGETSYNEFSQSKPAYIAIIAPSCNFVTETSRLQAENQKLISENQNLTSEHQSLISEHQVEKNDLVTQVEKLKSELNSQICRVAHYKSEHASEKRFRQSSQKRLIELQAQVADVMNEIDELRASKEKEREESAMGNMRCKVCFEETITHALIPCHHLALCGKCSQMITKCVICRKPKENVVRIYLG